MIHLKISLSAELETAEDLNEFVQGFRHLTGKEFVKRLLVDKQALMKIISLDPDRMFRPVSMKVKGAVTLKGEAN